MGPIIDVRGLATIVLSDNYVPRDYAHIPGMDVCRYILTAVVNMFNMLDWCCIVDIPGILFEHKHTVVLRLVLPYSLHPIGTNAAATC